MACASVCLPSVCAGRCSTHVAFPSLVLTTCAVHVQVEQALGDTARVVGAFVTYRNESSRLNCLKATPQSWIKQWWHLKPQHKFRGRSVAVHCT